MAEGVGDPGGGILSLGELIEDRSYRDALTADLMDRGFSLRMIGREITWVDVWAMVRHLDHTSHLSRKVNPGEFERQELMRPTSLLLGLLHDRVTQYAFSRAGQTPPREGIITQLMGMSESSEAAAKPEKKQQKKVRRPSLSASQARQLVNASMA